MNDEGTYFAVAQAMNHGYRLYANVWENKPPGIYLIYRAVYQSFGPSLLAIRLLATVCAGCLVLLTYHLALRDVGVAGARFAAALVGLLAGVPFLEGTTFNAELPLAVLSATAVYIGVKNDRFGPAGACVGTALVFKAVAGFDALALMIWIVMRRRERLANFAAGMLVIAIATGMMAWHFRIIRPMLRDAFMYDLGYVGRGNGGAFPWLLVVKLLCLAAAAFALRKRHFYYLWAVFATAGALFSGRLFGHYVLQTLVPVSLTVVLLLRKRLNRRSFVLLPCAFVTLAVLSALLGAGLSHATANSILARRLQYYANFGAMALRLERYGAYRDTVDDQVGRNEGIVKALATLPPGPLLVWGNSPWIYVLSHRLPATPYTSALRQPAVPGETRTLRAAVIDGIPEVLVAIRPEEPPLGAASYQLGRKYRLSATIANASIYVLTAPRARRSASGAARVIASASSGIR